MRRIMPPFCCELEFGVWTNLVLVARQPHPSVGLGGQQFFGAAVVQDAFRASILDCGGEFQATLQ
jgi:hypothetical protein